MRECISVARHLQQYGAEGFAKALANVLAHDAHSPSRALVADVFEAHGFEGVKAKLDALLGDTLTTRGASGEAIHIEYLNRGGEGKGGGASVPRTGLGAPKFGKVDPSGAPHVGGNTWAGGSGGSDTAGLGGRGGPFRLWDGNPVHQVSEQAKAEVSDAARAAGREQAQVAHRERLREIENMSEREYATYQDMLERVEPHVDALRSALESAKERGRERVWLKRRADGELDDERLVDGVAGDRLVFKRRGRPARDDAAPETATAPRRKRRIIFLMDVSGSMYRFHPLDGRLGRMLEATMLVMEALEGLDERYEYAVRGHSGDSGLVEFVNFGNPPPNRGERLKVLQRMVAHSQYCDSGDNTIEATRRAVSDLRQRSGDAGNHDDDDEAAVDAATSVVVALSDANFHRYGLDPRWWAEALSASEDVQGYAVMVGSIGTEAADVCAALPLGRGHVCLDALDLPVVFKRILQHARVIDDDDAAALD